MSLKIKIIYKSYINSFYTVKYTKNKIKKFSYQLRKCTERNLNTKHINYKLYYLLYDPFTFINAYNKIKTNKNYLNNSIISEKIISNFSLNKALEISKEFKTNSFKNNYIKSNNITQKYIICQEVLRIILENIYEPEFQKFELNNHFKCTNYGFRPNKFTWDAVKILKSKGQNTNFVIKGHINYRDSLINFDIIINKLKRRIKDKKFLNLIQFFLISNFIKNKNKLILKNIILYPILFNIYMFEFDKFVYETIIKPISIESKNKPKFNLEYIKSRNLIQNKIHIFKNLKKINADKSIIKIFKKEINDLIIYNSKIPTYQIKTLPKNIIYSRYFNQWVLLLTGTYNDALNLKKKINNYLTSVLLLKFEDKKILINNIINGFNFLGFSIKFYSSKQEKLKLITKTKQYQINKNNYLKNFRTISIIPDKDKLLTRMRYLKYCNEKYFPISLSKWSQFTEFEIVKKYNKIMTNTFNYYFKCDNTYILNRISYIFKYSCAKTIATRKRCSVPQVFKKYGHELTIKIKVYKNNKLKILETSLISYSKYKKKYLYKFNKKKK